MNTSKVNQILLSFSLLLLLALPARAQDRSGQAADKKEKLESMRIAFLTQKLDLSPQESQIFWPVYNQFRKEIQAVRKDKHENTKDAKRNLDAMTDTEVSAMLEDNFAAEARELEIKKRYNGEFKKVLPVKKVAKLYQTEQQFNSELLRMLQEKRDGKPMAPPPGPR